MGNRSSTGHAGRGRRQPFSVVLLAWLSALFVGDAVAQTLVSRQTPAAGSIVAAKGGEELQLIGEAIWRPALIRQDLVAGDTLRTGTIGNLAILFSDATQIRVGRNSTLIVKAVAGPVVLELPAGAVWARANRGAGGVSIETPAATAAVRGTDWSLAVAPDGRTALAVFDGEVEFYNAQGRVSVAAGEAAVASIGGPPTKTVLVRPNDREQMQFYLELRDAFNYLPATPLQGRARRAERARLAAIPPEARTAADWLAIAELALGYDGRQAATEALAAARRGRLSPGEAARADLVAAMLAGLSRNYRGAADLFEAALPHLDGRQRTTAIYGRYFAQALADPTRVADRPPPALAERDTVGVIGEAWIAGFVEGPEGMIDTLKRGEVRFPDDAELPALRVQAAILLYRTDDVREAARRAQELDPEDPEAVRAKAYDELYVGHDTEAALATMRRAAEIIPGDSMTMNDIGNLESDREANREAEEAYRAAIALDPEGPIARVNFAIMLLYQGRLAEAKQQIDAAAALDPGLAVVYSARGFYNLSLGEVAAGTQDLLAASAADPSNVDALILLAGAYYETGKVDVAGQSLDNADRLDPFNPIASQIRSLIAIDHLEADEAIISSRDAARRFRARGETQDILAVTRQGGSYVADSFRLLSLDAWARFYSDEAFDPFTASSYFDEAIAEQAAPFRLQDPLNSADIGEVVGLDTFSSLMQGLLIDPLAVSSRSRWTDPIRRPFFDPSITGGLVLREGSIGSSGELDIQAFSNNGMPFAVSANISGLDSPSSSPNDRFNDATGFFLAGATPTPNDRLVAFAVATRGTEDVPGSLAVPTPSDDDTSLAGFGGLAWSHSFGYRNAVSAAVWTDASRTTLDYEQPGQLGLFPTRSISRENLASNAWSGAVSHQIGLGPTTLRWGAEATFWTAQTSEKAAFLLPGTRPIRTHTETRSDLDIGQVYLDALYQPRRSLQAEVGLFGEGRQGLGGDEQRFAPRVGLGVMPFEGHWLRGAYRRDTTRITVLTLSPVTTVGLLPNPLPTGLTATTDSAIARWDAEWNERLFTALEYQHQEVDSLDIDVPGTRASYLTAKGRLDRLSATANVWLGNGFGAFASYAYTDSEDTSDGQRPGVGLPLVPEHLASIGASWVHPSGFRVAVAETYVGARAGGGNSGRRTLDPYWTTDAIATWDSPTRHLQVGVQAFNLFDADIDVARGVQGPGQAVLATLTARF